MRKTILFLAMVVALANQSLFAQVPSYVPTNGLVGYWPFNGNANDESGNGLNGQVNGALLTNDRNGIQNNAYDFNGINDFIEVVYKSIMPTNGNLTLSAWFKTNGYNNQNYQTIISKRDTYWTCEYLISLSYHQDIIHDTKVITARTLGMGNGEQLWSSTSYTPNVWEHWIVVYNNGQAKIYKNGILDASQNFALVPDKQNCPILFGKNTSLDNSEQFYGKLDDIGIWNRALTQQEITNLYNSVSSNECLTMTINTGVLSTNPFTYTSSVSIYPNPANDQITIDCGNLANVSGWSIKITNMLGQEVFSQPMNTQQYLVPLNTWSGQGMYFVKIINAQNEVVNIKKIILH